LPRSRPTGHAIILGAARGHEDRTFAACRCVCGARAGDKLPDEAASCGSVRPRAGTPRSRLPWPQVGDGKGRRCVVDAACRAAVAWRFPIGSHASLPRRGTARRVKWLSYSRTSRGTRTAARCCTPRRGRLGRLLFFSVEPAAAGRAYHPYRFCSGLPQSARSPPDNDAATTTLCTLHICMHYWPDS